MCSPARASIVTGVSPTTHGVTRNIRSGTTIDEDFPCYPQVLREPGYNVGLDGKWHVGKHPREFGFRGSCIQWSTMTTSRTWMSRASSTGPKTSSTSTPLMLSTSSAASTSARSRRPSPTSLPNGPSSA
ncbi:sulfatase-like hydrolase/transferase [Halorubrum sp. C191]|uniref:sulfatase-like hydrolase/transferase n=1 Tax=Halorubrum sp. C191 TaxID=1383842 RepID=UPI003742713D